MNIDKFTKNFNQISNIESTPKRFLSHTCLPQVGITRINIIIIMTFLVKKSV